MSEIAAAVVSAQLEKLPILVAARRRVAGRYAELLSGLDELVLPVELDDRISTWQSYVLLLRRTSIAGT